MRAIGSSGLGVLALVLASASVAAQEKAANPPAATSCPEAVAQIATCYTTKLETGAYLLAAIPKNWNGTLIVFAHGGPSVTAPAGKESENDLAKYAVGVKMGFAWVASRTARKATACRWRPRTPRTRASSSSSASESRNVRSCTAPLMVGWLPAS